MDNHFLTHLQHEKDLSTTAVHTLQRDLTNFGDRQSEIIPLLKRFSQLTGNDVQYSVHHTPTKPSPLAGKHIAFLGSSVTAGFGALGESFVDYLAKQDSIIPFKETLSGTTLVDRGVFTPHDSYVSRLQNIPANAPLDAFVLQLSTNDAKGTAGPLGTISSSHHYDPHTITGAIETILATVRQRWDVPILVYTNPRYHNELYRQMVERLLTLQDKWSFATVDLYHSPSFDLTADQFALYMADFIHPTRAGYQQKWLPVFEKALETACC